MELRGTGVRVATICPGYIATPMTAKNPYPMPFIITADEFARRFARAIDAGKDYAVIPWQMGDRGEAPHGAAQRPLRRRLLAGGRKPRKQ